MKKRAILIPVLIMLLLSMAACSSATTQPLVGGMWTSDTTGISLEFKKDGVLHYIQAGDQMADNWLKYEIQGNKIVIIYEPGNTETLPFSLNGDELTITWTSGNSCVLKRIP
ncbi:MAG TPA: hypothetical protein VN426_17595 [Syntrophomonadaceae bacterium]|nr:hypothetical protein [Syntrophomonadaceae bacterium]